MPRLPELFLPAIHVLTTFLQAQDISALQNLGSSSDPSDQGLSFTQPTFSPVQSSCLQLPRRRQTCRKVRSRSAKSLCSHTAIHSSHTAIHSPTPVCACRYWWSRQAGRGSNQLERNVGIDFLADMCDAATCKVESADGATHMRLATRFSSAILASGLLKHITTVLLSADTPEMACAGLCIDYLVQAMLAHTVRSHAKSGFVGRHAFWFATVSWALA